MTLATNAAERGNAYLTVKSGSKTRLARLLATTAFAGCVSVVSAQSAMADQTTTSPSQAAPSSAPTSDPLVDSFLQSSDSSAANSTSTSASTQNTAKETKVAQESAPTPVAPAAQGCTGPVDPYKNFACMDDYLGDDVLDRFINYYRLEWGEAGPPADPNALPSERDGWPQTPETIPPMAYTEFPTGALTSIGVTRPGTEDSPLMVAIANTPVGHLLTDNNFQVYGWFNPGFNISSNERKYGNAPIAYTSNPNVGELDQAVIYLDRWPDTVQTDHIDWGMRLSAIWGQNYRYTNSYGLASFQFNKQNGWTGYDFPMEYVDIWIPQVFEGLEVRVGRYISIPDIEAQLAPNNINYTHSITYSWDNYTNTGIVTSWQLTKNALLQIGVTDGTETPLWHWNAYEPNIFALKRINAGFGPGNDPLYPSAKYPVDPGNGASLTACFRWESDSGKDVIYPCVDGLNKGSWGYNNIQWKGFTYYHKFNDHWHIDFESYWLSGYKILNAANNVPAPAGGGCPAGASEAGCILAEGGTPFSPQYIPINSTNTIYCDNKRRLDCTANAFGVTGYINYSPDPLDNFSFRPEFYDDPNGWRTGTGAPVKYIETTFGWQHWFSPQLEIRPELSYWRSFRYAAYNGDVYAGIAPNRHVTTEFAMDAIVHF